MIAIISVVIMHCTGAVQRYYSNGIDTVFLITNIPNAVTRFSVPLFVMISGRLMINRGHDYKFLIRKTIHYMAVYLCWSTFYSILLVNRVDGLRFRLKAYLINTAADVFYGWFHFWFLFLICGLYLLLPVIEIIVNNLSGINRRYFIAICICFCFFGNTLIEVPFLNHIFSDHFSSFMTGFVSLYVFYFMLGYWLKDYSPSRHILYFGLCIGLFCNALAGNCSSIIAGERVVSYIDAQSPITLLVCICLFSLGNTIRISDGKARTIVVGLSKLSFGVYLSHALVIEFFKKCFLLYIVRLQLAFYVLLGLYPFVLWERGFFGKIGLHAG